MNLVLTSQGPGGRRFLSVGYAYITYMTGTITPARRIASVPDAPVSSYQVMPGEHASKVFKGDQRRGERVAARERLTVRVTACRPNVRIDCIVLALLQ